MIGVTKFVLINKNNKKLIIIFLVFVIIISSFRTASYITYINSVSQSKSSSMKDAINFSKYIKNNDVVLARAYTLSPFISQARFLEIGKDLKEFDAITYINWTSNLKVLNVMEKYNISFIIVYKNKNYEIKSPIWFQVVYNTTPQNWDGLYLSPYFESVCIGYEYISYKKVKTYESN